jgi:hypothetical protein
VALWEGGRSPPRRQVNIGEGVSANGQRATRSRAELRQWSSLATPAYSSEKAGLVSHEVQLSAQGGDAVSTPRRLRSQLQTPQQPAGSWPGAPVAVT